MSLASPEFLSMRIFVPDDDRTKVLETLRPLNVGVAVGRRRGFFQSPFVPRTAGRFVVVEGTEGEMADIEEAVASLGLAPYNVALFSEPFATVEFDPLKQP